LTLILTQFKNDNGTNVVGDGYTDCTTGIKRATDMADATGDDLFVPFAPGPYISSGHVLGGGMARGFRMIGEGWNSKGFVYPSSAFMLKAGTGGQWASLFTIQPGSGLIGGSYSQQSYSFEKLSFNGNKANINPSTISKVFDIQPFSLGGSSDPYPLGIKLDNCKIQAGKNGGVDVGFRRKSDISNTQFYDNGSSTGDIALKINTSDFHGDNVDIGGNQGTALYLQSGMGNEFNSFYLHTSNIGFEVSAGAIDFAFLAGSIDRNKTYGTRILFPMFFLWMTAKARHLLQMISTAMAKPHL
jgi:hypothetical protein